MIIIIEGGVGGEAPPPNLKSGENRKLLAKTRGSPRSGGATAHPRSPSLWSMKIIR